MYTEAFYQSDVVEADAVPEIRRVPIEEVVLQVIFLVGYFNYLFTRNNDRCAYFCAKFRFCCFNLEVLEVIRP